MDGQKWRTIHTKDKEWLTSGMPMLERGKGNLQAGTRSMQSTCGLHSNAAGISPWSMLRALEVRKSLLERSLGMAVRKTRGPVEAPVSSTQGFRAARELSSGYT